MAKDAALLPDHPNCLNCGTELRGQYCGNCGQRARSRLISLWELLQDAFGDLFEIDSRLWRTVIPLLARPGRLTRDYLEGRRARYMPPFRMYLVLSVIFFVVAFFDPQDDLSLLFEPEPETAPEKVAELSKETEAEINEVLNQLAEEGVITAKQAEKAAAGTQETNVHIGVAGADENDFDFEINPETARELGVEDGDTVVVTSPRGKLQLRARWFEGVMPGVVAMPWGLGHEAGGRWCKGIGENPSHLVEAETDPLTSSRFWNATRVSVKKA